MMPHAILGYQLPLRAGGGGQPSEAATDVALEPFSESVLSHLVSASKDISSQDGKKFTDEKSFLSYMASDKSNAMSAPVDNDLNYPMSSYFISSSHNTYLSGHQLYGDASVYAYTNVLKRRCRCLEIDVWDGESDPESSSSENEEDKSDKSDPKPSRWNRVKARAARMRSSSRSESLAASTNNALSAQPSGPPGAQPTDAPDKAEGAGSPRKPESSSHDPNRLSPHPSPSLSSKREPRVLHGYTLTHPITFRAVCHAIRESAFVSTELPLIVSLEVHASLTQQEVMVEIMRDVWSEFLVCLPKGTDISALPSPNSLQKKILIKVKWVADSQTGESNDPIEHVSSNSTDGAGSDVIPTSPEKRKKASKVLAALSELGIYTRAYTFKHFSQPEASIPTHVFSLSEKKIRNMHDDPSHGPALFKHNKNFLMRVFPRGTRINSSNVDPIFHWRQGAQMVALNWQKLDKGMMLNEGMFTGTGGWILKPEGYRSTAAAGSANSQKEVEPKRQRLDLEIRLLAAQRLPVPSDKDVSHAPRMKPYVKMQLHVDSLCGPEPSKEVDRLVDAKDEIEPHGGEDVDSGLFKRRSADSRTDCPDFRGEVMSWTNMSDVLQELSFIRLKLMDDRSIGKDNLLAWACIRLDRLQQGYRFIHLLDSSGMPSRGALLVHVCKRTS
ncbi:hypothetical protein, variant 5 [Cladophialophora immunda]|uniref:Phosphoinositide phospholipase C n=1 Tax=Cladophialophora immunda TaxID=569365 RepID=A0A0D2AD91_9EURO|nr:uncharacterized protein PV07_11095 [Cladophialophora immunda]XP_016243054.1 hypothetical protein, variant 1 [Cladophialophora immunda]XP_016243055.1 hypothetical protein, variant 2 [Cladophialophora immunda]XP_016243056.1 hypothetical protein, variant 3 [Cladophialophora immunda]XP_016243057.1 hypothetical protein, variant 4 [Cladophialophora immunda]XP_016243058.1 hypothetical protein, variant 5 [Cladophialophora immunda]KIW22837.1 hypothetical protein PV07_11095 [Cladophialophora immunda